MDQYHTPALGPALAEGGPVGRVLLDDLIQGGLGIDGVGVELALAVRVVADLAVVALARLHKVLAQPWGNTHMTLIQSGGLRIFSSINFGRRGGGGPKIVRASYVYRPLSCSLACSWPWRTASGASPRTDPQG